MSEAKIKAIAPWFGSNRLLAANVGKALAGCNWVGVPFAGGMCELLHIKASTIVVGDLHRHVMNLASVIASGAPLAEDLAVMPFHPDVLKAAQLHCLEMERGGWDFSNIATETSQRWALNYFIACWMNRSALAGTDKEFSGNLPVRWSASGGDSNTRYRSAVASLDAWREVMRRCNFVTLDVFDFLKRVKDADRHGLYLDPPFPDAGDAYKHKFTELQQRLLAVALATYRKTRVVCRFYDHPLIREIYPADRWTWQQAEGRDQANGAKPEVLLISRKVV